MSKQFVLGALLGSISAIQLNQQLPPYWDGDYSNTWTHTDKPRFVNQDEYLTGNPYGYTQAVFGENVRGQSMGLAQMRNHHHHHPRYFNSFAQQRTPTVPDNYNRVNAWTDPQWEKTHPSEWTTETAAITQGGYNVALSQQATPTVPDNYNRVNAWTDPQQDKTHPTEWTAETAKITQGGYNVAAQRAQRFAQTPTVPDNYNRVNAWTDPQQDKTHPTEWTAETAKITQGGYNVAAQKSLRALAQTPTVADNYNRVNAWTDPQQDKTHPTEWTAETAKITQGGYNVAAQRLAQTPTVPDNYNRVNAWTDPQQDKTHPSEWTTETAKITQGGYNVAAQKASRTRFAQTPTVPDNYNRVNAWTDPQQDKTHPTEWTAETAKITQGGYNVAAQKSLRNSFVQLPNTPDSYNLQDAWTDDQVDNMEEDNWIAESRAMGAQE